MLEDGKEDGQVAHGREGGNRDGDGIGEQRAPTGEEGDELVEALACEVGGAAGLGHGDRRLRVREDGQDKEDAGEGKGDGSGAEGEHRGDAEGVVNGGTDVAVARAEEGGDPEGTPQT